jgi:hypothetical protein
MKKAKWFFPVLFAVLGIFALVSPVLAITEPYPSTLQIQDVQAYQNAWQSGDQLYLITYYIGGFDTAPNETATQLFIFRLLGEDGTEIASAAPYAYYDYGYGLGVVAFYLSPSQAPAWESDLTIQLIGNPVATFNLTGGKSWPQTTADVAWNNNASISAKVISLANQLGSAWGVAMTTTTQGLTVLSDDGAAYFQQVVPYFIEIAPFTLGQYSLSPTYPAAKPSTNSYSTNLLDELKGTVFDLRGAARDLGTTWGVLATVLWYGFIFWFFIKLQSWKKMNKGTMMLMWPLVIMGVFFGVPIWITILAAFGCLIATVWVIYSKSLY